MELRDYFNFNLHTNLSFGPESIKTTLKFLRDNKFKRISIIIDYQVDKSDYWQKFMEKLKREFTVYYYFKNKVMEPTYDYLEDIRELFNSNIDCLLGVGGGSSMDLAKAISVLVTNKKKAITYRGFGLIKNKGIPLILLPSTAGSGSEITPFAVFIDTKEQRKFGINSTKYLPILTIIDPYLTISCPASITIASGMDAIIHTLESFGAKKHTTISRLFAKAAFPLLINNIDKAVTNPKNIEIRSNMSLGAFYAGIALFNAAAGPAGVLSYPLGTLFHVTHGLAGAVFIYPIVEYNVRHGYKDYGELYDLIDKRFIYKLKVSNDKSKLFLTFFKNLCRNFNIPDKLNVFGVEKIHIEVFIRHLKPLWASIDQNPVTIKEKDIRDILDKMID